MTKTPPPIVKTKNVRELLESQIPNSAKELATKSISDFDKSPQEHREMQVKMSAREMSSSNDIYLKPIRSINSKETFNEKFRSEWEDDWKYVKCVVENYEIIGEDVETWTKKYAGDSADYWRVPVNKPIYIPKLLAKQLSRCKYHRFSMEDRVDQNSRQVDSNTQMTYQGSMIVDKTVSRIDAKPAGFDFDKGF